MNGLAIDQLSDSDFEALLKPIFDYLTIRDSLQPSDVIFVFGSRNMAVAEESARLWKLNLAPIILCTSKNAGPNSKYHNQESEADIMANKMIELGVTDQNIIREKESTNTLENITFGMGRLQEQGIKISSAILVAKAMHMRRCVATFNRQYPEVKVLCSPPTGSLLESIDRPRHEYLLRLLAEIERLETYAIKDDIVRQNIPDNVRKTVEMIRNKFSRI